MTSLAAIYDWLTDRASAGVGEDVDPDRGNEYQIRALPKEEIDLYVKRIDNSRLARTVDNRDFAASIGVSGIAALVSVAIILLLAPGMINLLASRTEAQLRAEHTQLMNELRRVQAREGQIFSAQAMRNWQEGGEFVEPTAASTVFAPPAASAVASRNH